MSKPQRRTGEAGARAEAFDRRLQDFWAERICTLRAGQRVEVWLTPRWSLSTRYVPMSVRVGGPGGYSRGCELRWFRDDCFEALEGR